MTVPIAVSPGRSGFGPQLSLSYDSGAGNGPFGLGWALSLPQITRKTDKGLPRYRDGEESDVFILSGAEDLVPMLQPDGKRFEDPDGAPGYLIHRYRPRIEGLFARIERWTKLANPSDVHWRPLSREWALQRKAAAGELTQLFKQFRGAEIREYIAKTDHDNACKQIAFADEILEFLTNEQNARSGDDRKTTTEAFYLWMKREVQGFYARSFDIAHDLAKRAESAAELELPQVTESFIGSSYLAGIEGLLAGEKLYLDLKRLELAYLDANTREFELVKHVSLKEWFPIELLKLRSDGKCEISIPEAMFNLDCPGHNFRRIKNVAVSIPCVLGPYASMNCSLTLCSSYVRKGMGRYYKAPTGGQASDGYDPANDTTNFQTYSAAVTSIVTSSAQSDSGVFDVNPRDERHLPFEYAGAISEWSIELLGQPRPFDYDSIADVVLTIRYTTCPGGSSDAAQKDASAWLDHNAARSFSMRHEFATEWAAFKQAAPGSAATLKLTLDESHYPYRMKDSTAKAQRMHLVFTGDPGGDLTLGHNEQVVDTVQGATSGSAFEQPFDRRGSFELDFPSNAIEDLWVVVDWSTGPHPADSRAPLE
jgi:hypothetical protein